MVMQGQGKARRQFQQYGEGMSLLLQQGPIKSMGNKVWEVNWEKVSGQQSLGWRWRRLFEHSLRSMDNKEELEDK